ncbi:MAG: fe-S protein assembly co-chaperone HscB [Pseudomonadota bacterium]
MNPSRSESPAGTSLLTQDYFSLFGLPRQFDLEADHVESAWKRLQSVVHPDRFAGGGDLQRRMALQWSTRINEAHQVLREPVGRATYLLGLWGMDIQAESNTSMPEDFLLRQMAWREELEEIQTAGPGADTQASRARLLQDVSETWQAGLKGLSAALSAEPSREDLARAAQLVRQLMFVKKFEQELTAL